MGNTGVFMLFEMYFFQINHIEEYCHDKNAIELFLKIKTSTLKQKGINEAM